MTSTSKLDRWWQGQVDAVRAEPVPAGTEAVLWHATADASEGRPVAAGVLHLHPGVVGAKQLAFELRDMLRRTTGDRSISVMVVPQGESGPDEHDGYAGCGIAEADQYNPYDPHDDPEDYDERDLD